MKIEIDFTDDSDVTGVISASVKIRGETHAVRSIIRKFEIAHMKDECREEYLKFMKKQLLFSIVSRFVDELPLPYVWETKTAQEIINDIHNIREVFGIPDVAVQKG